MAPRMLPTSCGGPFLDLLAARAGLCDNGPMSTNEKQISIADAIAPLPVEPVADVAAWHIETVRERHKAADAGRFASAADVQAVIRKYVPHE